MKKYHVASGDGKGYYGLNYESYREAVELLKISQSHDPQAHIIEEEYHFTNADRIRAMSDEELANWLARTQYENMMEAAEIFGTQLPYKEETLKGSEQECLQWLKQPAGVDHE